MLVHVDTNKWWKFITREKDWWHAGSGELLFVFFVVAIVVIGVGGCIDNKIERPVACWQWRAAPIGG